MEVNFPFVFAGSFFSFRGNNFRMLMSMSKASGVIKKQCFFLLALTFIVPPGVSSRYMGLCFLKIRNSILVVNLKCSVKYL